MSAMLAFLKSVDTANPRDQEFLTRVQAVLNYCEFFNESDLVEGDPATILPQMCLKPDRSAQSPGLLAYCRKCFTKATENFKVNLVG